MTFTLHVDAVRWRTHQDSVRDQVRALVRVGAEGATADAETALGDLVPVAKGNGYGVGNVRLAREAARLGVPTLAVGTAFELPAIATAFDGDLLVLAPYEPADAIAAAAWDVELQSSYARRIILTIGSATALTLALARATALAPARVVIEGITSTGRYGLQADEIDALLHSEAVRDAIAAGSLRLEGLALHEPMAQPGQDRRAVPGSRWHDATIAPAPPVGATERVHEVLSWALGWQRQLGDLSAAVVELTGSAPDGLSTSPALWLSHLTDDELATLRGALPGVALQVRIGTRLWLGDREALVARGTVLAVHDVTKGERSGYRQRRAPGDGMVLVVGGGTSHGVALAAPSPATSMRQRVVTAGSGVLEAGGRAMSPFTVAGKQRWFAEPPHMHVSLIRVPGGIVVPPVGGQVDCDVRLTTCYPDVVLGLD